jgi:phosphatidylglycerophosphate synthase
VTEKAYQPERRPLATRERAWARGVASWLVRRGASPNAISLAGLAAAVSAGAALALTPWLGAWQWAGFLAAALFVSLRLLANMFDGMVALASGRATPLGELYNEIPDRGPDAAVPIGAGYATGGWPELGYLAACLALFLAYVRAQGKVAGAHQEFCGPMAKPQRMAAVVAGAALCAVLPHDWQPELAALPGRGVMAAVLAVVVLGGL